MNNRKKLFLIFVFLITTFVLVQYLDVPALAADVGNTFSNNSNSNSSYDDGYSSGYSSGSSDSDIFWIIYMIFRVVPFPFNIILVIGALIFFSKKNNGNRSNMNRSVRNRSGFNSVSQLNNMYANGNLDYNNTNRRTNFDEDSVVRKIRVNDETFSKNEFVNYVNTVFIKVQEAWENRQWNEIRPFESNELFERHESQLNEYIEKNLYPHLDRQEILSTKLAKYELDGKYEYLTVQLRANLVDFLTDESGEVVRGSKTKIEYREYKLNFKRVNGVKTKYDNATNVTNCPNCGAPSNVTSSGKCEYCSSVITTGEYGWVLDEYSQWRN